MSAPAALLWSLNTNTMSSCSPHGAIGSITSRSYMFPDSRFSSTDAVHVVAKPESSFVRLPTFASMCSHATKRMRRRQ